MIFLNCFLHLNLKSFEYNTLKESSKKIVDQLEKLRNANTSSYGRIVAAREKYNKDELIKL